MKINFDIRFKNISADSAVLIIVILLAAIFPACSNQNDQKPQESPQKATKEPEDKAEDPESPVREIEYRTEIDGDRVSKMVVRHPVEKKVNGINYPPDAILYQEAYSSETIDIILFPEYSERKRFSSNGYAIFNKLEKKALFIDPGIGSVRMMKFWADQVGAEVTGIAATHGHLDHTGGVRRLKDLFKKAVFYAPKKDVPWIQTKDLRYFGGVKADAAPRPDKEINGKDLIPLGSMLIDVIETPGHTTGSVCFSLPEDKLLFTGDTLFKNGIGRTNFDHSLTRMDEIFSIQSKLMTLDDKTVIYPGHGMKSTISSERKNNRFLKIDAEAALKKKNQKN